MARMNTEHPPSLNLFDFLVFKIVKNLSRVTENDFWFDRLIRLGLFFFKLQRFSRFGFLKIFSLLYLC